MFADLFCICHSRYFVYVRIQSSHSHAHAAANVFPNMSHQIIQSIFLRAFSPRSASFGYISSHYRGSQKRNRRFHHAVMSRISVMIQSFSPFHVTPQQRVTRNLRFDKYQLCIWKRKMQLNILDFQIVGMLQLWKKRKIAVRDISNQKYETTRTTVRTMNYYCVFLMQIWVYSVLRTTSVDNIKICAIAYTIYSTYSIF